MTSRERVRKAVNHEAPDRVPLDLGSTSVTGVHASAYKNLKDILDIKSGRIKIIDPFQMLAEVEEPVKKKIGIDTYGVQLPYTIFGFKNEQWKHWGLFDDMDVLISGHFEYDVDKNGDILAYPLGDKNSLPSGRMTKNGYYFDAIVRQKPIVDEDLDPKKWVDQTLSLYSEDDMMYLKQTVDRVYEGTEYSIIGNFCDGGLGDIGVVPGLNINEPDGIRDPEEWYVSLLTRKNYIKDIFGYQTEVALKNLKMYQEACGEKIDVIDISETDFGGQRGLLFSGEVFREMFKPFFKEINDWVHKHTGWKVFYHTCGSVIELLDDFVEIGIDILNPVQYSAEHMDLSVLKKDFGSRIVLWGGGVDTQRVLPFGKPEEVEEEVINNLKVLAEGGGFVFSVVHNIQANIPMENLKAMLETFQKWNSA
jgi:hypothetical protein